MGLGLQAQRRTFAVAAFGCVKRISRSQLHENKRGIVVGLPGFEPGTSCTPKQAALSSELRYSARSS